MRVEVGRLRELIIEATVRPTSHGIRHRGRIPHPRFDLVGDTRTDPDWAMITTRDGEPVARQARFPAGQRYMQGTNPDYEGYAAYPLQYWTGMGWQTYDSDARRGDILFKLDRLTSRF